MTWRPPLRLLALASIVLVGAALRGDHLGAECFDCDELYAVRIRGISPQVVAQVIARDGFHTNHPPLMTVPFLFWVALVGPDEGAVRALPFLAALVTIVLVDRLGSRLGGPRVGLIAAMLVAFNPLHVAYAREARQYEVLTLLVVAAHLGLLRCLQRGRPIDQALYATSCTLLALTHYFGAIALSAHGLVATWLITRGDRASRLGGSRALMCLTLAAIPCLAWLPVTRFQASIPWRHLIRADVAGLMGSLRDVIGVRTAWDVGWLGVGLASSLIFLGCWAHRRATLVAEGEDLGPPFSRAWGAVAIGCGLLALGFALSPLADRAVATARVILVRYGYEDGAIDRELRALRQLFVASALALGATGVLIAWWAGGVKLAGRWFARSGSGGRSIDVGSFVALLVLGPLLATWLIGLGGVAILQTRNLIVLVPPICLGLALGMVALGRSKLGRPVAVATASLLILGSFQYQPAASLVGREGYELGMSTYDWKSMARWLLRPEPDSVPLLACRTPSTDPILFYAEGARPRRLSQADGRSMALPGRFHFAHIERDPESESLLRSLGARGAAGAPVFRADRLVLIDLTVPGPGRAAR